MLKRRTRKARAAATTRTQSTRTWRTARNRPTRSKALRLADAFLDQLPLCPYTGKIMFGRRKAAETGMRLLRESGINELHHAYECSACEHWHITKQPLSGRVTLASIRAGGRIAA